MGVSVCNRYVVRFSDVDVLTRQRELIGANQSGDLGLKVATKNLRVDVVD